MRAKICFSIVISVLLINFSGLAQEKALWSNSNGNIKAESLIPNQSKAVKQHLMRLNTETLQVQLKSSSNGEQLVDFPNTTGKISTFKVTPSSVMHPDLAEKYSSIRTFKGYDINKPDRLVHFTVSSLGVHALILSPNEEVIYIDPITKDGKHYRSYYKKNMEQLHAFECDFKAEALPKLKKAGSTYMNDLKLRTFKLALATTEEYAAKHVEYAGLGAGSARTDSINVVMAALTVSMTRVNAIFERDLAMTTQLIANNDQLIFLPTDPGNDPYTNNSGPAMLTENQATIDNIIGFSNYDIGHVFSTGGGGVAYRGTVCTPNKAGGVTGSDSPIGDPFDIDYVAHEMGHQFGANHTFNGDANNCSGTNRNNATAVEPGSGSTIMGYANLCAPQNVQSFSDAYFHSVTINEIFLNITTGNSTCATVTNFVNNTSIPVADAGLDRIIPKGTPFILTGTGTDADGDVLTYTWEQSDNEVANISIPPSETQTEGAVFRSMLPTENPERYFPNLLNVLAGSSATWEVLPNVARTLNFNFTVRDNALQEGQTSTDEMEVTVTDQAGPFIITSQSSPDIVWEEGTTETITWDVAGTTANGVDVSQVEILMSTDGGLNFSTVLNANTANDGSEQITVPNTPSSDVRIMVKAKGNVFYAVNSGSISIGAFVTTCEDYNSTNIPLNIPDGDLNGVISTLEVTEDFIITDVNLSVEITHTWLWDLQIYLIAPDATEVLVYDRNCGSNTIPRVNINATFDDSATTMICDNADPAINGTSLPANILSVLNSKSSLGTWKLKVVDNSSFDVGTLDSWSLNLCQTNKTVNTDDFAFRIFKLFPNPAINQIQIYAEANNSEPTTVILYDLRGRTVFKKKYNTTGQTISKNINLGHLAKGVYLVNLKKGRSYSTKKLIIQ